mmetsp:Transcript_86229/g.230305  ORF Transcript_86229/g.230305 Transcript_86229/m.230305 type:complete len:247 (+) Transcript_86229:343-1083(+)
MKNFTPVIVLSQDDFHRMTKKGTLCDEEGCLTPEQFDSILRDELERHLESKIAEAYELAQNFNKTDLSALFGGLKILRLMAKLRKSSSPPVPSGPKEAPELGLESELVTMVSPIHDTPRSVGALPCEAGMPSAAAKYALEDEAGKEGAAEAALLEGLETFRRETLADIASLRSMFLAQLTELSARLPEAAGSGRALESLALNGAERVANAELVVYSGEEAGKWARVDDPDSDGSRRHTIIQPHRQG